MYNTVIFCLDKRDGLSFGGRRLSRDNEIFKDIEKDFGAVAIYSEISAEFLKTDKTSDTVFCEVEIPPQYLNNCQKAVIYRFDREYPFDISLQKDFYDSFALKQKTEMQGNSHDKIFKEIWEKIK
ncbi:MAG: hypothetical protein KBS41_05760 [Oscillospiraceae bacterium]|nr:hypothetical protein [Candidatus Equicaccousia limihippi]